MATKPHEDDLAIPHPGFPGPGYGGFGGSAGYSGSGVGGISGGYAGTGATEGAWRPVPDTLHDDDIERHVREHLAGLSGIDTTRVQLDVEAGVVTLTGSVATRALKHAAGELAARAPRVHRVHNHLHVEQPLLEELRDKLTPHRHQK